jgi:membrane protease YdiL (CAAX protease family)
MGWVWNGWRSIIVGLGAFLLAIGWMATVNVLIGESIPYNLPGNEGVIQTQNLLDALGVLILLIAFVLLTVVAEETMFRGFIQTQIGERYGVWMGFLVGVLLFGLRHLPADIFYANVWGATAQMWIARQVQLYGAALLFGLARHFGKSTYASAIMHALLLIATLLGL